jgi:hypothetical protein
MNSSLTAEDLSDEVAVSVAHILAQANRRARQLGCEVSQSLLRSPNISTAVGSGVLTMARRIHLPNAGAT